MLLNTEILRTSHSKERLSHLLHYGVVVAVSIKQVKAKEDDLDKSQNSHTLSDLSFTKGF